MGTPDQLRVRLLGGLEVDGLDERALGSRKARTLVKVLALGRGAPVTADTIVEALWPGADRPAKPHDQVGVLVSRLRNVLGPERLTRTDAGWRLAPDWLDITELAARVDEAAARLAAGSPGAARAAAGAALALVRGELVADEVDAPWAEVERGRVARDVARARLIAADAALAAGDAVDAAAAAEGALDHDPYDEAALRVLMRAHTAAGRPASALAAYARVRERLRDDLGVDPVNETEELHTAILMGNAPVAPSVAAPAPALRVVGRERELARLDAALAAAHAGSASSVVIEGDAGIGKTALVTAWVAAHAHEAELFSARCDELGRGLPLQPLFDALAARLREGSDVEIPPSVATLLGPIAVAATNQPTLVADPVIGQAQLFADLLGVFERLAGERTCVVVVEDVHLGAESTVEWLYYAAQRGRRILVVTTRRFGPPGRDVVRLAPLDLDAVRALVGPARAEELMERSGGHPLFLVELAAAPPGALPDSVRTSVAARVDGLGEAAGTIRAAAILGSEIDIDLLAGVVGAPVAVLLEHLEEGIRARLLAERGAAFVFEHELVREALEADTTAARRAFVHREAARLLRGRPRSDPSQVAFHAQRGGDVDLAAAALIDAAAIATERFDMALAEELLGQAITMAGAVDALLARARVRIARWDIAGAREDARRASDDGAGAVALEVAAWVEYYARDYELAARYGEEAVARSDDPGLRASCLAMSGRVAHASGNLVEAERRLVEAVDIAPPAVRGYAQTWLGGLRMHQGQPDAARDLVDRALAEQRWLGHPFARHHNDFFRVLALGQQGRIVEALAACDAAIAFSVASGEPGRRFVYGVENARTWLHRTVGVIAPTLEVSTRIRDETADDRSMNEMHHAAMLDLIDAVLILGDVDAAVTEIARARSVDTFAGTMGWHLRQRYRLQQARLALVTGEGERAHTLASEVVDDAQARGWGRYGELALVVQGRAAIARGDAIDHDQVDAALARLDVCAAPEAWRFTAELAAAAGVERWWRDAERRAGALVATAGEHAETLRQHVAATLTALGR